MRVQVCGGRSAGGVNEAYPTMEVLEMSRFLKVFGFVSVSAVFLMQAPCTTTGSGGFSVLPNIGGALINSITGGTV